MRNIELVVSSTGALSISGSVKDLGRMGEIGATQLTVNVDGWTQAFENAMFSVLVQRSDKTTWPLLAGVTPIDGKLSTIVQLSYCHLPEALFLRCVPSGTAS